MGCCIWLTKDKFLDNSLDIKIKELNKITNSRYFYERSKIKIKFTLITKKRIKVAIVTLKLKLFHFAFIFFF